MPRAPSLLLLAPVVLVLSGCLGLGADERETSVRYWQLVTTLEWDGEGGDAPVFLEQGPHCSWLTHRGDHLTLRRDRDGPRPAGHALGRIWGGDLPEGSTTGGGFDWWLHDGTVPRTVGGDPLLSVSWDGDVPVLDGEARADGWNRTTRYSVDGLDVAETVTLRDHGTPPLTVRTQRELHCE